MRFTQWLLLARNFSMPSIGWGRASVLSTAFWTTGQSAWALDPTLVTAPQRIIALGGYGTSWSAAVVSAQQTPYADQVVKFSPEWPSASIEEYKNAGFVITDLAGGDRLSWAVVMSRYNDRATPRQQIYGPGPIDDRVQTWLASAMKSGYHITEVAGMENNWVVVVTTGLSWGKQRFTLPGPYKHEWVQARLNEGYQITSAAGGRIVYPDNRVVETYMFVATQNIQWGAGFGWVQVPRDQFNEWFKQQRDVGTPTALTGLGNLPGAFFATGHPFGKSCGYILGAKPEQFLQWVGQQRLSDREEEPKSQSIEDLFRRNGLDSPAAPGAQSVADLFRNSGSSGGDSFTNSVGMTLIRVDKGYYLAATEVTQAQWQAVMGGNPSYFQGQNRPVEQVSWNDAMAFCQRLTEKDRAAGKLPQGHIYTLPTDDQWEYACRAVTTGDYAGNLDEMAWYDANSGRQTHDVAMKKPNAWGFYDMHGNVSEWCANLVEGQYRANRGGSWLNYAGGCRSGYRGWYDPGGRGNDLGFRPAAVPSP